MSKAGRDRTVENRISPDADGFVWEVGFMSGDVSVELLVEHLADKSHRRQSEELAVGQRRNVG
jgi:hypothetical protein